MGAPLAETLKKAKGARYEYNADFGVDVVVGNVMIRIPDEDITKEGQASRILQARTLKTQGYSLSAEYIWAMN